MRTEYRTIYKFTFGADTFLQFKSQKETSTWPFFWRTKLVTCWRFVPQEYMLEHECPEKLEFGREENYVACHWGGENNAGLRLFPLARDFPHIKDYLNSLK